MNDRFDSLLSELKSAPLDHSLGQLEPAVWAQIDVARRRAAHEGVWSWRAALAAVMLATGAFAGGVAAAQPKEASPFSIHASLAPSTLLEISR